jgi:4-amino-4-deoxy-L-arabinose transferase-like glycosyltransferase
MTSAGAQGEGGPKPSIPRWIVPAVLLLLYAAQCAWFIGAQSLTFDEPVHIAEGLDAWRNGRFQQYNDHPPLARLLCTLPLLDAKWQVQVEPLPQGFRVHSIQPDPVSLAWRARSVNAALGVLLGILLWFAAADLFSRPAANFALALFAFSPSLIANFSLVTTDGAATLLIFAVAYGIVVWKKPPSWKRTIVLGVVLGLLLLAKFSTLPMFALAVFWMLVRGPGGISFRPEKWNWSKTAAAVGIAFCILWAGYFFHVSHLTIHDGTLTATFPNWTRPLVKTTHSRLNFSLPVPAGEFIAGFRDVAFHNAHGQPAFFLGKTSPTGGWKSYYPVTILLKWPIVLLVLSIAGLLLTLLKRVKVSSDLWILSSFPAVYFALAIFAHFNLGERHILPLYPFALLCAAAVWQRVSPRRGGVVVLGLLLICNAWDGLRSAPGYLAYFDPLIPNDNRYRLLADSNLDWGQGLLALRKYEQQHPGEQIWLAYFGSVDPAVYGIQAQSLAENQRVTGTVIVGATNLSGEYLSDPAAYRWLLAYGPPEVLDGCLYVFHVPIAQGRQAVVSPSSSLAEKRESR